MEIIRGSLDDISRPASSELTSSRVSSVSLPHNERIRSSSQFALVVLTNDIQGQSSNEIIVNSGAKDSDNVSVNTTNMVDDEENLKLLNAIEEMKRLDEILSAKTLQEQEAKRKRKELRDKLWSELLQNTPNGRSECAHEASNTRSFLALEAPTAKVQEEEIDFEPVFETQAPESDDQDCQLVKQWENKSSGTTESSETNLVETEEELFQGSHYKAFKSNKKHKDFVKINIELISGEGGQEFLTQAEKERLDELLQEIDQEEEDCARGADAEEDVWAVSVFTGHGYTPEPPDLKHLHDIDSRIRLLLPVEEFASLQGSFSNLSELQGRGSETGWKTDGDLLPGEKVLKDIKERRGQERRLQEIQQQLEILNHSQDMTDEGPDLTEEQLLSLLEDCELTETWSRDIDMNDFILH